MGAIAAALGGFSEGREQRREREERERQRKRQEATDTRAAEQSALELTAARLANQKGERENSVAVEASSQLRAALAGDKSAVAWVAANMPNHPLTTKLLAPDAETFGDLENVIGPGGKPLAVQRGNRGTLRESPYAPYVAPKTIQWRYDAERGVQVNPETGEVRPLQNLPKKEETDAQLTARTSRALASESRLRGDYTSNPLVKDAYGSASALAPVFTSLKQQSPLGDLMALYGIVKLFDPGSVVKEGEIKLAQSATSLPQKVRLLWENTARGRKIPPEYRTQIEGMVEELVSQRKKQLAPVQREFGASARRFGVDSSAVAPDPFLGLGKGSVTSKFGLTPRGAP